MNQRIRAGIVCVCLLFATATAGAQSVQDPSEKARFNWGAVRFTPTLEITSFGRDSNVFNEAENPKSDVTIAVGLGYRDRLISG